MSSDTTQAGPPAPPDPFDVGVVVSGLIKHDDHSLIVSGRRLKIAPDEDPESVVERYRRAVTTGLLAREPKVDETVWASLVDALQMQLRDREYADNQTLDAILHAIDTL